MACRTGPTDSERFLDFGAWQVSEVGSPREPVESPGSTFENATWVSLPAERRPFVSRPGPDGRGRRRAFRSRVGWRLEPPERAPGEDGRDGTGSAVIAGPSKLGEGA